MSVKSLQGRRTENTLLILIKLYNVRLEKQMSLETVFTLDALALSVIATATWLAGWVAVTLRYYIKTAKPIGKLFLTT